jgi:glutamine amidotransferase
MPFFQEPYLFLFNGELRGVRIREEGASGAEKIFRYIRKVQDKGMYDALRRGSEIIQKKSLYVKAMNILIADPERFYIRTFYSEQEDYFALRWKADPDLVIVSSQEYPDDSRGWGIIPNGACIEV